MVTTFKLIVGITDNSIDVLKYIKKHIKAIKRLNTRVKMSKISTRHVDKSLLEILKSKGITRLPALIAPDGKVFIGKKKIIELFDSNLNRVKNRELVQPARPERGDSDLSNYWMKEMYSGRDNNGKLIPRNDPDEPQDEGKDINERMREYEGNVPTHRRPQRDPMDTAAERMHGTTMANPDAGREFIDDIPENIASEPRRTTAINIPRVDDDMDQKMLAAWVNNNSTDLE